MARGNTGYKLLYYERRQTYVDNINYISIDVVSSGSNSYYHRFGDDMAGNSCYNNTNRIGRYNYKEHL